ncbi:MAG TPA: FtsW/RodA/SpoVE family cell cycle protein, partial [Acidimicrobiales bacterium]
MSGARTTTLDPARTRQEMVAAKQRHPSAQRSRRHRRPAPPHFYALAIVIALLTLLGLVMVQSASSITALLSEGSGWVYFRKQLLWAALGLGALLVGLKIPYHAWRRLVGPILLLAFGLMVLVLVPGLGRKVNGARAWISVGPFGLQPAEVMKLALLLYTADLLARREHLMNNVRRTLGPALVMLGAAGMLIMLQPDLGSAIVLVAIVLAVAFIAGSPMMPLGATAGVIASVGLVFALGSAERRDRWTAFMHLMSHRDNESFQVVQGIVGIASGGISGVGLGASRIKWGWLPEAHTDMIFAVLAEELGVVGVV